MDGLVERIDRLEEEKYRFEERIDKLEKEVDTVIEILSTLTDLSMVHTHSVSKDSKVYNYIMDETYYELYNTPLEKLYIRFWPLLTKVLNDNCLNKYNKYFDRWDPDIVDLYKSCNFSPREFNCENCKNCKILIENHKTLL